MAVEDQAARIGQGWEQFRLTAVKPETCVRCGRGDRICWDGHTVRTASVVDGDEVVHVPQVRCRRIKCKACEARWVHLPPGMIPRKHYQPCVVARATSRYLFDEHASQQQVAAAHGCSRRTVGRWLRWLGALAESAVLMSLVLEALDEVVLPRLQEVAGLARKVRSAAGRLVLERAAQVLQLLEALAMARRLEPPGLRAVLAPLLHGRAGWATYRDPLVPDLARRLPG